jgi:membrane protein required for colicin V production
MANWQFTVAHFVFNIVDIVILALAFLAAVVGATKGFAREFSARAGFLVGLFVALQFTTLATSLVVNTFDLPLLWSTLIAFIILFAIGYIVIMIIGSLLEKTLHALKLAWLDHLLGLALGVVELLAVVALIVYLLELQNVINLGSYFDNSLFVQMLIKPLTAKGLDLIKGLP